MTTGSIANSEDDELRLRVYLKPDVSGVFDFLKGVPMGRRPKLVRELITMGFTYQRMAAAANVGSVHGVVPVPNDVPEQAPVSKEAKKKAAPFPEGQGDNIYAVDAFGEVFGSMSAKLRPPRE